MPDFTGKVVVVTGGASGLGRALADRYARAGARLALLDLDPDALAEATGRIQAGGVEAIGLVCDVADESSCERAFEQVHARLGDADVLINNAGITHRSAFAATETRVLRKVIEVNLLGSIYCTKLALDGLIRRRGRIAAISSMAGLGPLDGRTAYAASKHALHGLFDSLRSELRSDGVSVTLICPTFVATGIGAAALSGDGGRAPQAQVAVGRVATAEETAEIIYRAIKARRRLVIPSRTGRLSRWINVLAPSVYERLMSRAVRAELEG